MDITQDYGECPICRRYVRKEQLMTHMLICEVCENVVRENALKSDKCELTEK